MAQTEHFLIKTIPASLAVVIAFGLGFFGARSQARHCKAASFGCVPSCLQQGLACGRAGRADPAKTRSDSRKVKMAPRKSAEQAAVLRLLRGG